MEMLGKIRRMYFRDKLSLHQIAKRTGLSRNTIRKWVRAPEATQPAYQRFATFNKLSPFHETLTEQNTPGVDKVTWNTPRAKICAIASLKRRGYPSQPHQSSPQPRDHKRVTPVFSKS